MGGGDRYGQQKRKGTGSVTVQAKQATVGSGARAVTRVLEMELLSAGRKSCGVFVKKMWSGISYGRRFCGVRFKKS